jgi:hypothetical protein
MEYVLSFWVIYTYIENAYPTKNKLRLNCYKTCLE